jgi:hypothetical protein
MEYIHTEPIPARSTPQKVAEALQWLRRLPDTVVGSMGGGRACYTLFKDTVTPLPFSITEALERYMDRVRLCLSMLLRSQTLVVDCEKNQALKWRRRPKEISFGVFTQSDMDESNFFIDANGKICLIEFNDTCLLPESFASYTVHLNSEVFIEEATKHLYWLPSSDLPVHSMVRAGTILHTVNDPTLGTSTLTFHRIATGMDKDGLLHWQARH